MLNVGYGLTKGIFNLNKIQIHIDCQIVDGDKLFKSFVDLITEVE